MKVWLLAQCGHSTDALLLSGALTNLSKWTRNSVPFDVVSVLVHPKLSRVACFFDILYCINIVIIICLDY